MKITVHETTPKVTVETGDIVEIRGSYYICHSSNGEYMLNSLNGSGGAVGAHPNTDSLCIACKSHGAKIYSHKDYELKLVAKS